MSDRKTLSVQRAVEIAAEAFASRNFDDVTVAEISEAAQCSTTTIYSIFGNKEGLFLEAMTHLLKMQRPEVRRNCQSSFGKLICYSEARVRNMSSPIVRGAMRAITGKIDATQALVNHLSNQQCGKAAELLSPQISDCVRDGILRPLETDSLIYSIMAVTAYEPIVFGMLYGNDRSVDVSGVLRKTFTPLVSRRGEQLLDQLLAGKPANDVRDFTSFDTSRLSVFRSGQDRLSDGTKRISSRNRTWQGN